MEKLAAAIAEAPYIEGLGWLVSYTGIEDEDHDDNEIQAVDTPEVDGLPEGIEADITGKGWWSAHSQRWVEGRIFEDDGDAQLMVLFLALDGDKDAKRALRDIGCTKEDFGCLGRGA
jgi:hypothetical protein